MLGFPHERSGENRRGISAAAHDSGPRLGAAVLRAGDADPLHRQPADARPGGSDRLQPLAFTCGLRLATFTLTSLADAGVSSFTAIIGPGHAGALAVGADAITLSADARIVTPREAAAFLKALVAAL